MAGPAVGAHGILPDSSSGPINQTYPATPNHLTLQCKTDWHAKTMGQRTMSLCGMSGIAAVAALSDVTQTGNPHLDVTDGGRFPRGWPRASPDTGRRASAARSPG